MLVYLKLIKFKAFLQVKLIKPLNSKLIKKIKMPPKKAKKTKKQLEEEKSKLSCTIWLN